MLTLQIAWLWVTRFIKSASTFRKNSIDLDKVDILCFVNGNHIQTPSFLGLVGDKYELWLMQAEKAGSRVACVLNPFSASPSKDPARKLILPESLLLATWRNVPITLMTALKAAGKFRIALRQTVTSLIYEELLRRSSPKLICGVALPQNLLHIARKHSIPTVEFQHGLLSKFRQTSIDNHDLIPDFMACWDSSSLENFRRRGHSTILSGYPLVEGVLEGSPRFHSLDSAKVLVTLAYDVAESIDQYRFVHRNLHLAISLVLDSVQSLEIRIHPCMEVDLDLVPRRRLNPEKIRKYFKNLYPAANVSFSSEKPLLKQLSENNLHLTHESSTVIEAAIMGVPSICLHPQTYVVDFPDDLLKQNLLWIIEADEIKRTINLIADDKVGALKLQPITDLLPSIYRKAK